MNTHNIHFSSALRRMLVLTALALGLATAAAFAQSPILNPFGGVPAAPERGGFYLYDVAVFGQYSSTIVPLSYAFAPGSSTLGADEAIGGSATLGWSHPGPKGQVSMFYSPSYIGMVHYSGLNSFNQTLSFSASRRLAARWSFTFSAAANDSTIEQLLFSPTFFSNIASIPANASDLSAALLNGTPTNSQLASLITGAPLPDAPTRALLYGMRILTATGRTSLNYQYSPRTSVRIGFGLLRLQDLPSGNSVERNALLGQSTSGSIDATIVHFLTPRTQIGATVTASRNFSRLQDAYIDTGSGFIARTLTQHWFVQGQAGIGTIRPVQQTGFTPTGPEYIAGGSVGYHEHSHTLIASVNRTAGDAYAYGAGSTITAQAAWNWHRRGSPWALYSTFGEQQFLGVNSRNATGWLASAGFSRALSPQMALQAQYAFLNDSLSSFSGTVFSNSVSVHSVRVALVWSPIAHLWR